MKHHPVGNRFGKGVNQFVDVKVLAAINRDRSIDAMHERRPGQASFPGDDLGRAVEAVEQYNIGAIRLFAPLTARAEPVA
ncbi:MAG: hypothetical protein RBS99_13795 [Rhodospirillales bacterium]|nr:hypothetical protein [Rhodospirillales bacterium]